MVKTPIYTDTKWEVLRDRITGCIKNGFVTLTFAGFSFNATEGDAVILLTLPEKYRPKSTAYFGVPSNTKVPNLFMMYIDNSGKVTTYALEKANNIIGTITHPI